MKHKNRILSLFLVLCMLATLVPGSVSGADGTREETSAVMAEKIENPGVELRQDSEVETLEQEPYDETEVVRAIVVLENRSLLEQGFTGAEIASKGTAVTKQVESMELQPGIGAAKNQKADRRQSGNPQVPLSCGGERHGSGASLWDFGRSSGSAGCGKSFDSASIRCAGGYDQWQCCGQPSIV